MQETEIESLIPLTYEDLVDGCTLLVDKPLDWTSFDVCQKIRSVAKYKLGLDKLKVGHAGTLDPRATGLLIICLGKHTKRLSAFQNYNKEYTGSVFLGATTPSYDTETKVDRVYPIDHISPEMLESARQQFIGPVDQIPPAYSAIKKDGVRAYQAARKGEPLALKSRLITILEFELTQINLPVIDFRVACSKGTYIRSLAFDFGRAVNAGAYLKSLIRTRVGPFKLENAWNLENLVAAIDNLS
ncbi:MAG TPA: tRNA pseudouridine(55) synthase TruB [Saprospiraceae bacterium]|nr:tRNA pseudouridine(55) synthase TruB [Lewinellaceae bacterium]HPR00206.1 tRNA pseudouridine(55) synthase TruB [Saprospiraceae bacterium]HRV85350.1 tRNA pseudouridine(55) synthase TruB [Saprospiraceae bacterium]